MQNNTNENISAILSIKKSWFKPFKPIKFTLSDVSDSEVALFFDEYDEIRYMAEKAERVILEYLNTNKILHFKRKDLEDEFRGELSVSSIKNALRSMEERNILTSKGMTKDRTFTLIHTPENLTKSS